MSDKITVIVTVYNEKDSIEALIESLLKQSFLPYEIIVTDAGSTDGTWEILEALAKSHPLLRVISVPGNRSKGRNAAISAAKTAYIAVTDAGCVADSSWLLYLYKALQNGADVASGFYEPLVNTPWEKAIAAMTIPSLKTVRPESFLPSSRSVAFTKSAWQRVGGYPEDLTHNEDTPFDLALKKAGFSFIFVPQAIVFWRPRPDLKAVYKQFFHYALGDGEALILIKDYLLIFARYLLLCIYPWGFLLALLLWGSRLFRDFQKTRNLYFVPLRFIIDFADMLGFIAGRKEAWKKWRKKSLS